MVDIMLYRNETTLDASIVGSDSSENNDHLSEILSTKIKRLEKTDPEKAAEILAQALIENSEDGAFITLLMNKLDSLPEKQQFRSLLADALLEKGASNVPEVLVKLAATQNEDLTVSLINKISKRAPDQGAFIMAAMLENYPLALTDLLGEGGLNKHAQTALARNFFGLDSEIGGLPGTGSFNAEYLLTVDDDLAVQIVLTVADVDSNAAAVLLESAHGGDSKNDETIETIIEKIFILDPDQLALIYNNAPEGSFVYKEAQKLLFADGLNSSKSTPSLLIDEFSFFPVIENLINNPTDVHIDDVKTEIGRFSGEDQVFAVFLLLSVDARENVEDIKFAIIDDLLKEGAFKNPEDIIFIMGVDFPERTNELLTRIENNPEDYPYISLENILLEIKEFDDKKMEELNSAVKNPEYYGTSDYETWFENVWPIEGV